MGLARSGENNSQSSRTDQCVRLDFYFRAEGIICGRDGTSPCIVLSVSHDPIFFLQTASPLGLGPATPVGASIVKVLAPKIETEDKSGDEKSDDEGDEDDHSRPMTQVRTAKICMSCTRRVCMIHCDAHASMRACCAQDPAFVLVQFLHASQRL